MNERLKDIKLKTNNSDATMLFIPKTEVEWLIQTIEQQQEKIEKLEYIYKKDVPYFINESKEKSKQLQEKDAEIERLKEKVKWLEMHNEEINR